MTTSSNVIYRPRFNSVPLAVGLRWRATGEFQFSEKLDGRWHVQEYHGATIVGELMKDGDFYAFDVVRIGGDWLLKCPLRDRWEALQQFKQYGLKTVATGSGAEFLEAVLRDGGEGVVAKSWNSIWVNGAWFKCKRVETFDCLVTEKHRERMSVRLAIDGADAGWCAVLFSKFDLVQPGDVIEVACFSRTASGKLREPRFVRIRRDKQRA